jgi:CheY-like chemotaxis protein
VKFFSLFSSDAFPCIEKALARRIGAPNFRLITDQCPDRRFIIQVAAEMMQIGERELLVDLAKRVSLQVAPRVVTTELDNLPAGIKVTDMRKGGFIAIVRDNLFHGIICSNPARIPDILRSKSGLQYLLAPWSEIAKAIALSENTYEDRRAKELKSKRANDLLALNKVLDFLALEVEQYGQSDVKISLEGDKIHYLFKGPEGKSGKGEVNSNLIEVMREFLDDASGAPKERSSRTFEAEMYERGRYYLLRWQPPKPKSVVSLASSMSELAEGADNKVNVDSSKTSVGFTVSVLLIDDNDTFGAVVERFFAREGILVERSTSAADVISRMKAGILKPRVIVCDVHMPQMNGLQFIRALRADNCFDNVAVVMLTSDEQTETELEVIKLGGEAYVRKSQDPRLLCAHVERLLKKSGEELKAA